jgi:hypothetical protein
MNIIPRSAWGAAPAKAINPPRTIEGIIVHWVGGSGMSTDPTDEQSRARIRNIQAAEQSGNNVAHTKYNDISYSFLIDPAGRVYEGHDARTRQAASNDFNKTTLSICYIGGPGVPFTSAAQQAMRELSQMIASQHPAVSFVSPHSKVRPQPTDCPGGEIRAFLPSIGLGGGGSPASAGATNALAQLARAIDFIKTHPLKRGDAGNGVKIVQNLLNAQAAKHHSAARLAVTGAFDAATEAAVKFFQGSVRLTPDGKVGKHTIEALVA